MSRVLDIGLTELRFLLYGGIAFWILMLVPIPLEFFGGKPALSYGPVASVVYLFTFSWDNFFLGIDYGNWRYVFLYVFSYLGYVAAFAGNLGAATQLFWPYLSARWRGWLWDVAGLAAVVFLSFALFRHFWSDGMYKPKPGALRFTLVTGAVQLWMLGGALAFGRFGGLLRRRGAAEIANPEPDRAVQGEE